MGRTGGREGPCLEPWSPGQPAGHLATAARAGHSCATWRLPSATATTLHCPEALTLQATSRSVTLTQDSPAHPSLGGIAPQLPTEAEALFCGWAGDPRVQMVVRDPLAPDVNAVLFAPKCAHSSHVLLSPGCPVLLSVLVGLRLPTSTPGAPCLECACVHAQSCPTLYDAMDCSPPGSSVHGISQAIILE